MLRGGGRISADRIEENSHRSEKFAARTREEAGGGSDDRRPSLAPFITDIEEQSQPLMDLGSEVH